MHSNFSRRRIPEYPTLQKEFNMVNQDPNAVPDADAAILAALLRLAAKSHGGVVVQGELLKIKTELIGDQKYWVPFGQRISQIKKLAGLE